MCLEVFIGQGFNCNCRKQSGMLMSHQPLVMSLWHMQSSPHIRQRWFPRRPQLCAHHHHVVHFPSFMQFIDNCLRASSICLPHTAHALSWASPISHTPPAFSSGKSGITIWFPRGLTLLSFSPFLFFMALIWNEKLRCCILLNCIAILAARDKFPPYWWRRFQSSSAGLTRNHQIQDGFSVQWTEECYCCVVGREWPVEARSDRLVCALLSYIEPCCLVERHLQWKLEKERRRAVCLQTGKQAGSITW